MKPFHSLSIRSQLYLMAFIIALPAAGIIIYSGLDNRNNAMIRARTDSMKLADSIATEQQALVASTKQLLGALAQFPDIQTHDSTKVSKILADIHGLNPQFLNIYIADSSGFMWASALTPKGVISIADRRHFINARDTGRFSSGEYFIGRILGKPTLAFANPYKNQKGEFAGVIVANVDLNYSRNLLQRSKLPDGSSYALLDHRGIILDRGINPAPFVGKQDRPELFQRVQAGPDSGSYIGPGLDGSKRFVSYRKLRLDGEPTPYMYIRAGIPVEKALANAHSALYLNLALMTSFMLSAFFIVWLIAKRTIINPITTLQNAARTLAAGELQVSVATVVRGGELGELARAFDEMAGKLSGEMAECKAAEDAQRASERFIRTIIDTEPECVKMLSPGGSLLMMNRAGLAMIGADSLDQVREKSVYPLVAPEYRQEFEALTDRVYQGEEGSLEFEIVGLTGRRLWVHTHAVPFRDEQGEIVSLLAITRDISERKKAELEIMSLNAALEERATELEKANVELETFNYTISHDLCNPLTLISGYCQAMQELATASLDDQCRSFLDEIYKSTVRMSGLIDTLLNFSRLSHVELQPVRVDLSELAQVAAAELRLAQPERPVTFRIAEGVTVDGDENLLRIVMVNLFGNSWKYTADRDDAVIQFESLVINNRTVYCVRDNGIGFDMTHADKLFIPFQRLPGSRKFYGHGIGLATVQKIILRHGGKIWAEGEKDRGASFYFML